jgi:antitoxin (DNA-binding transcriptional repressor) of toxin-antitoxin stability system
MPYIGRSEHIEMEVREKMSKIQEGVTVRLTTAGCPVADLLLLANSAEREAAMKRTFAKILRTDCALCLGLLKPECRLRGV